MRTPDLIVAAKTSFCEENTGKPVKNGGGKVQHGTNLIEEEDDICAGEKLIAADIPP